MCKYGLTCSRRTPRKKKVHSHWAARAAKPRSDLDASVTGGPRTNPEGVGSAKSRTDSVNVYFILTRRRDEPTISASRQVDRSVKEEVSS